MAAVATQQRATALPVDIANVQSTTRTRTPLLRALPALKHQLSQNAAIYLPQDEAFESATSRFSDYKRPLAGAAVCPATEADIVTIVKWANAHRIKFLARAGGHGWSMTLSAIGPEHVLINLRAMNDVKVDRLNSTATIGAGSTTGELLKAAQDGEVHVVATACDTVGAIPSIMGGGIGNLVSNYGLGCDNILSARVITADGSIVTASKGSNSDLLWALRGAGHNFGIVSELTVKAYPQINNGQHWSGMIGFPGSKEIAEKVLQTIGDMGITKGQGPLGMGCTAVYGRPTPDAPTVLLKLSFNGSKEQAMEAFAPLYALTASYSTNINDCQMLPADSINESKDSLCAEGGKIERGNKPVHSASLTHFDIPTMGVLYQRWEDFTGQHPDASETLVRINCYDYRNVRGVDAQEAAFAWRERPINVLQYWSYTDSSMDEQVQQLGKEFREALTGGGDATVIMNFASGNERPAAVYGPNLEKLRALKEKWDPEGAFSYYNSC